MAFYSKIGTLLKNTISISANNAPNTQSSIYNTIRTYATKKSTKKSSRKKAPKKTGEFKEKRSLRQLTVGKGKTAGRNSSGRITSFHRGGGAKGSQRIVDVKRNTSSMGIVERIEYDPNRSTRIALVRWKGVAPQGRPKVKEEFTPSTKQLGSTETTVKGLFAFSSLPGDLGRKSNYTEELFLNAFARKRENATESHSFGGGFPRVVVAGAKAPFFAFRMRESVGKRSFALDEVQKWKGNSSFWAHRMKRKAAVSWSSHGLQKLVTEKKIAL